MHACMQVRLILARERRAAMVLRAARLPLASLLAVTWAPTVGAKCEAWCSQYTCEMGACSSCGAKKGCRVPSRPAHPPPQPPVILRHPPYPPMAPFPPPYDAKIATQAAMRLAPLDFKAKDGQLWANGEPFRMKGVTWFGAETRVGPPLGLDKHSVDHYLAFLQVNGFNTLRIPFCHGTVLKNEYVWMSDEFVHNPELGNVPYVHMLQLLVRAAARRGILVVLQSSSLSLYSEDFGYWYSSSQSEDNAALSWDRLGRALCHEWNVIGVDLQDNLWKADWGSNDAFTDWRMGATRLGNAVLQSCPRWLVMVQGVGKLPEVVKGFSSERVEMFHGENLMGASQAMVELSDMSKLVYIANTGGPGTEGALTMERFRSQDFPANLENEWYMRFGFVQAEIGVPLVIGEFVDALALPASKAYMQWAVRTIEYEHIGVFVRLNRPCATSSAATGHHLPPPPSKEIHYSKGSSECVLDSHDAGVLLQEDWESGKEDILEWLKVIRSTAPFTRMPPAPPGSPPLPPPPPPPPARPSPPRPPPSPRPPYPRPPPPSPEPSQPPPPSPPPHPSPPPEAPPPLPPGWECTAARFVTPPGLSCQHMNSEAACRSSFHVFLPKANEDGSPATPIPQLCKWSEAACSIDRYSCGAQDPRVRANLNDDDNPSDTEEADVIDDAKAPQKTSFAEADHVSADTERLMFGDLHSSPPPPAAPAELFDIREKSGHLDAATVLAILKAIAEAGALGPSGTLASALLMLLLWYRCIFHRKPLLAGSKERILDQRRPSKMNSSSRKGGLRQLKREHKDYRKVRAATAESESDDASDAN